MEEQQQPQPPSRTTGADVQLIIKAPSSKYEDFKISCQLSWTIFELKTHISEEYPSKPKPSDQRLIYSGHLLKDEQHLRDIIELSGDKNDSAAAAAANNTYTFHLVCANRSTTAKQPADNIGCNFEQFNTFNDPWSNLFAPANGENPLDPNHSLDRAYQQAYYAMMQQYCQYMNYHYSTVGRASGGSSSATTSAPAPDYAGYLAFANTYLRGMNNPAAGGGNQGGGGGLAPNVPPPPFLAAPNAGGLIPPNQNQNNNVPAAAGAAGVVNRNNRNNNRPGAAAVAGAGAAPFAAVAAAAGNVDDLNNRDWMDMMYSFCKAMVILSVMYFYSSMGRLLLLLLVIVFLYLYKTTRLQQMLNNNNNNNNNVGNNNNNGGGPVQPEEANNNNNNNNVPANPAPPAQEAAPAAAEASPEDVVDNGAAAGALPDNSRYTGLRLIWVFVSSLFTSLIPDPVPIN
ncbi:Homocysteine-responsive endoplasmic reticulum-resident ubiquitin-like domain member 1 protein [Tyrophagus putrescentiae]|nr:Homocysteine-responsive endoplasmic reticulum-resident ubiquitin-like domain member 1 protein [Tyrophagus putrescentiae]